MATDSSIEWTDSTWNPVLGCTKVSAGCKHCYAERMAKRLVAIGAAAIERGQNAGKLNNYSQVVTNAGRWNGNVYMDEASLAQPSRWRSPKTVFVNSMSDMFHEKVPDSFIQNVFDVMNSCPQHTFQLLTKRPERAAEFAKKLRWSENIWLGTSVEDTRVVGRIRYLRKIPAFVRFLSVEPLLGPIPRLPIAGIDWVIVGGESGPGARPMRKEWVSRIRDRCTARGVPFFFKQWGGVQKSRAGRILDGRTWDEMPVSGSGNSR